MIPNRRTKKKKQKRGFPIEDFGNDERGDVIPEWFYCLFSSPLNDSTRSPNYKGDNLL